LYRLLFSKPLAIHFFHPWLIGVADWTDVVLGSVGWVLWLAILIGFWVIERWLRDEWPVFVREHLT